MSGDWIKVELSLPEKPEIWHIAGILGIDSDAVVGKLIKVWRWFDQQTESGSAKTPISVINGISGIPGFAEAMMETGWLAHEGGFTYLPGFDKHNGATAKNRADTARRVAKHKANVKVTRELLPRPVVSSVKERDGSTCVYCGRLEGKYTPPETSRDAIMSIDHVIPVTRGGSDDPFNLVCACSVCNTYKSDRTPDECSLPWPKDKNGKRMGNLKDVTRALPREEKRREDIKASPIVPIGDEAAILSAYHSILPKCKRIEVMNPKRKKRLASVAKLARSVCTSQRWPYDPDTFWLAYFGECAKDPWMRGDVPYRDNPAWKQNLETLISEDRFAGVMDVAIASMRDAS